MNALLSTPTSVVPPVAPVSPGNSEASSRVGEAVPYRFTVDEYRKLGEAGILSPESRVELIDGYIVCKPMQNLAHAFVLQELQNLLARLHGPRWAVRSQLPVHFPTSVPEPDIAVLAGPPSVYRDRRAEAADVKLIVEISDASLIFDSTTKAKIYASNSIPAYWIVNIPEKRFEMYSNPTNDTYRTRTDYVIGQSVPVVLDGETVAEFAVADIFG